MTNFDPNTQRLRLDGDTGYNWALGRSFDVSKDKGGLASSADAYLNMAVRCILVGYDSPADALIRRAFDWLNVAVRDDEKPANYARGGTEAHRHLNLALCAWFLHGEHDSENFSKYVSYYEEFLKMSPLAKNKTEINLALPHYVDARAYREALERFNVAAMSPPSSLAKIRSEGQMSYVLCQYNLDIIYKQAEVNTAVKGFLKSQVEDWLANGHFLRAAEWMKITRCSGEASRMSAKEAVLACYDYLSMPRPPH